MERELEELRSPIPRAFIKELNILGLPRSMGVLSCGTIAFSLFFLENYILTIFSIVVHIVLALIAKFTPKFDPKFIEILSNYCLKSYIDY